MPKNTALVSPCKALHGCNGLERGKCSHAASLEQQHKHLTSQQRPSLFERWGFKSFDSFGQQFSPSVPILTNYVKR